MIVDDEDKANEDMFLINDDKSDGGDFSMPTLIVEEEPGAVIIEQSSEVNGRNRISDSDNLALTEDIYEEGSDDEKDGDIFGWEEAYEQEV